MMRRKFIHVVTAFVVTLLAACGLSTKEQQMIDSLTKDMETHCVGRHLIDFPISFKPIDNNAVKLYYGKDKDYTDTIVTVLREGISKDTFELRVQYEASNIATELRDDYKTSMLISNSKLGEDAYLLRMYRNGSTEALKSLLYILRGSTALSLLRETFKGESVETNESHLKRLASQIRAFTDPEKAGRGFCMGHIVIDGDHDFEQTFNYLNFSSDKSKDILWQIHINSLGSGDEGLLKRWKERQSGFEAMTGGAVSPVFHSGQATVGNMPGEEMLAEVKDYGKLGFSFTAESLTAKSRPGFEKPSFKVDMDTGSANASNKEDAVDSSWSKEEALGVWNAVIKSIRLRPGAL